MKKNLFVYLFFLFSFCFCLCSAAAIPQGLWQNENRLLFFRGDNMTAVLKMFYGWYYDPSDTSYKNNAHSIDSIEITQAKGATQAKEATKNNKNTRNNTTVLNKEPIKLEFLTLGQEQDSWAGLATIGGQSWQAGLGANTDTVPLCVIDDSLYLDFGLVFDMGEGNFFIKKIGLANTIGKSPFFKEKELNCLYVTQNITYNIRYWQTDMPFSEATKATFLDGDNVYTVDKFIKIGDIVFTCCNSREVQIRTVSKNQKSSLDIAKENDIVYNKTKSLCGFGKPYLKKVDTKGQPEEKALNQMIKEANKRQHKIPPLVFPLENAPPENNAPFKIEGFSEKDEKIKYRQSPY